MHLQTCFIYELAELETLTTKKAVGEVKGLLSSSIDTFRPPYGRNVIKAPRPSVLVGTVNEDFFSMTQLVAEDSGLFLYLKLKVKSKIAATALKGLGYFQDEKRMNGIKAQWWFKRM